MVGILAPNVMEKYVLGPVKSWVKDAAYYLGPRHGIKVIGGWRKTDEFPDHPTGHAIDIMVPNKSVGDAVAQDAINNYVQLGIVYPSYLIWWGRVWNSKKGWHPYTSTSNPHHDHVHITMWHAGVGVPGGPVSEGDAVQATDVAVVDATCAWKIHFPVAGDSCIATHKGLRKIMGGTLIGTSVVIGLVGVVLLVAYGLMNSDTAKDAVRIARFIK